MPTILNLPIEPIENRYSVEWDRWFEDAFRRNHLDFVTVRGEPPAPPPPGKFLNPTGTFVWKFSQLAEAARIIQQHPDRTWVVFLHDAWQPGIEMFAYMRDLAGLGVRICGWWHAGAYDPTDLLGLCNAGRWAAGSERTWFELCDLVVTGSQYHARRITTTRGVDPNRIRVLGYPVVVPAEPGQPKENLVVWPHRLSADKRPEWFDRLSAEPCFAGVRFVKTLEACRTKAEYHDLLCRAKVAVSTATHENFGIGMVEAALRGCHPICPRGLAYVETMEGAWLFDAYEDLRDLVSRALAAPQPYDYPYRNRYAQESVTDQVCALLKHLEV